MSAVHDISWSYNNSALETIWIPNLICCNKSLFFCKNVIHIYILIHQSIVSDSVLALMQECAAESFQCQTTAMEPSSLCFCCAGSHRVCRSTPSWMNSVTMLVRGRWWRRRWVTRCTERWWGTAKSSKLRESMWVHYKDNDSHMTPVTHLAHQLIIKSAFSRKPVALCHETETAVCPLYPLCHWMCVCFLFGFTREDEYVGCDVNHLSFTSSTICWTCSGRTAPPFCCVLYSNTQHMQSLYYLWYKDCKC